MRNRHKAYPHFHVDQLTHSFVEQSDLTKEHRPNQDRCGFSNLVERLLQELLRSQKQRSRLASLKLAKCRREVVISQEPFGDLITFCRWFNEQLARAKNKTDRFIALGYFHHLFKAVRVQQVVLEKKLYVLA